MSDTLKRTLHWFEKAVPVPLNRNQHTQLGVHLEEVSEMLEEMKSYDYRTEAMIRNAQLVMHELAEHLKGKMHIVQLHSETKFLDSLCDQAVTLTGVGHMCEFKIVEALSHTNDSNFSKFDENGEPIFNEARKIIKGPNYFQTDLTPFISGRAFTLD